MLEPVALNIQLARQTSDRLRVLIVGAGIAGLTLAQLLRADGLHPVVIDRMPDASHPGYMLALMPLVDRALDDLGVHEAYRRRSTALDRFTFHGHRGPVLRSDPLGEVLRPYGEYRGIDRGALVDVLTADGCPVAFGTTVTAVRHDDGVSRVAFADRDDAAVGEGTFDLVIGADGMHSRMRGLLSIGDVQKVETGWSGWIGWADDRGDSSSAEELWGNGFFLGVYPVQGRVGVILCRPDADAELSAVIAGARRAVHGIGPRLSGALDAMQQTEDPYLWRLEDARAEHWVVPGAALLGDAATGFLPTAGIGAGMAIESAWMLARMMHGADPSALQSVLAAWERVEQPRAESAQANSRTLAKLMFRPGATIAWLRETAVRAMSIRAALGPILTLVADQPDPDLLLRTMSATR
ncbi:NAD(P)/FAD-dependent oxidoreductase [Microbacterium panaciterrae]|uniref:FAD-dependent monooxygenase n=1 Tax=Microbacterium panaciterrae TaxID=985759 RepID=A0ABP8PMR1_9MICO